MWTGNIVAQRIRIVELTPFDSNRSSATIIYLPSNSESYNSLRLSSMGSGLNGIVSDGISDYFRNPAYLNMVEQRAYYLDFDNKGSSNDLRISFFSPLLNGQLGLSFSGNTSENITTNNRTDPELDLFQETVTTISSNRKTSNSSYNIHLWWANNLSENFQYGFNYIKKRSDFNSSRVNTSSRTTTRTNIFNESTTVSSRVDSRLTDNDREVNVNTIRVGLIFGSLPGIVVDMVLKAEFNDINSDAVSNRITNNSYSYIRPNYSSTTEITNITLGVIDSKGNNSVYGMKINVKKEINESVIQSYFLSFDRVNFDFSENENETDSLTTYQKRDSIFSNTNNFFLSELNSNYNITTAYVLGLGFGREIRLEKALVGIGAIAKIFKANWDDELSGSSTGLIDISNNDTTYQQSSSAELSSVNKSDLSAVLISFPLGGEVNVSNKVSLRLGVEFNVIFSKNKITSSSGSLLSNSENRSLRNIKSFGIGYKHSEKFSADLMAIGDLARISAWRISIKYGL